MTVEHSTSSQLSRSLLIIDKPSETIKGYVIANSPAKYLSMKLFRSPTAPYRNTTDILRI